MSQLVAVWHSDPTWGDPFEGVFWMESGYSNAQLAVHAENRAKRWFDWRESQGNIATTRPALHGPLHFEHTARHDLSEDHRGDDEFVFVAWFKKDKPDVLTVGEVEDRRLMAQRYGVFPPAPLRRLDPLSGVRHVVADEFGNYIDPWGLTEAGLKETSDVG